MTVACSLFVESVLLTNVLCLLLKKTRQHVFLKQNSLIYESVRNMNKNKNITLIY